MENTNKLRVIILCGGKGERLKPLTDDLPKPLIKIKGSPILSYIISHLGEYEIKDLIIATGYKSDKIHDYFTRNHKNTKVQIVDSGDVDIVERIQDCAKYIDGDFLVLYGDTLSNVNIKALIEYHHSHHLKVTMTTWPLQSQFGLVDISPNGQVLTFQEKPVLDKWINIGYFYFNYECLSLMNGCENYVEFLHKLACIKELNAFKHTGIHITVNTLKELEEAEKNIVKIFEQG